jgi:hypothetical protein
VARLCLCCAGTYSPDNAHVVHVKPAVAAAKDVKPAVAAAKDLKGGKGGAAAGKGHFVRL